MAGQKQISVQLQSTNNLSPGVKAAAEDIRKLKEEVTKLRAGGEGSGIFEKLREGLGRRSALGEATELLNGGGSRLVGGLTEGAEAIKKMAEEAGHLRQEFNDSKIGAVEMTQELLKSLPVVGKFADAGEAINELFTGQKANAERLNEEAKSLETELNSQHEIMKSLADETRKYSDYMAQAAIEVAKATLPLIDAQKVIEQIEALKKQGDIDEQRRVALAKIASDAKPGRDAANAEISKARDREAAAEADLGGDDDDAEVQNRITDAKAEIARQGSLVKAAQEAQEKAQAQLKAQYAQEDAAADKVASVQSVAQDREAAEKLRDAYRQSNQQIADDKAEFEANIYEQTGDRLDAELTQLRNGLQKQLAEVEKHAENRQKLTSLYDEKANDRNADQTAAERQAVLDKENAAEAAARKADDDRQQQAYEDRTEDMEAYGQKMKEEARAQADEMNRDNPLQKYKDRIASLDALRANGLTDSAYAAQVKKANDELQGSAGSLQSHAVASQVRRFDRDVDQKGTIDPIKELVNQQKANNESAKLSADYLQKIYDLTHNDSSVVVKLD